MRLRWWQLAGTRLSGCRVVAFDAQERVLMIRHSYGSRHWMLPGGGMKRGEDALAAAIRECREECGLHLADPVEIGVIADMLHGSNNDVRVIAGWIEGEPAPDLREIEEARCFALHELPDNIARSLPDLLPGYLTAAKAARRPD